MQRPVATAMSQEAILEKVRSIVAEQLSVDSGEVKPESNFQNDLGADSLDTVELVMALEEAFDIEIPDEMMLIVNRPWSIWSKLEMARANMGGWYSPQRIATNREIWFASAAIPPAKVNAFCPGT